MSHILKDVTQNINQSAVAQLKETDSIAHSTGNIQELLQRNAKMIHELRISSDDLSILEINLADNMGHFLITQRQLPPDFGPERPTIAFVRWGTDVFFKDIYQGMQTGLSKDKFQSIALDSQGGPVEQAENINWLLQQHWLKGILLAPADQPIGKRLIANVVKQRVPIVAVDFYVENAAVSVLSDNTCGGEYAAELLRERLPGTSLVLVCGARNISSVACRMDGFSKKIKSYQWEIMEFFAPVKNIKQAKMSILGGLNLFPDAQGVFLTNETTVLAYLELLREGKLSTRTLCAVGFDITPVITQAIVDGILLGTIVQDPVQIGRVAIQELLSLLRQHPQKMPPTSKEVLVPVKKVTRENIASNSAF
jgi:ABC-type sugar transport system substrate-binding protein